jgi:predicted nucleotidyltransferase
MFDALRRVLEEEPNLAFALVFGSARRGTLRPTSDVDVAVEFRPEAPARPREARPPAARLESAARRRVDLILLDSAPAALTYRIFPDRRVLLERDHPALARRKAQAILQYLDFKPVEERCAEGLLRAAVSRGVAKQLHRPRAPQNNSGSRARP